MKMTIEKIIEIYNELDRIGGIILKGNSEEDTKYNIETIEALQGINIILHKYQKIQEVMDSRPDDDAKSNSKALGKIEVIMYENDD